MNDILLGTQVVARGCAGRWSAQSQPGSRRYTVGAHWTVDDLLALTDGALRDDPKLHRLAADGLEVTKGQRRRLHYRGTRREP